jgi:dipeptidyl aminopeptidase/acylaminoacyl peptidase
VAPPPSAAHGRRGRRPHTRPAAAALFAILLAAAAHAQRLTIEDLLSAPFNSQLIAAANRVAWVANDHGARNLWMAEGPDWKGRQLTSYAGDNGVEIGDAEFTPDGEQLIYVRGGDLDTGGDLINPRHLSESPDQAIWIVGVGVGVGGKGGAPRKIADGNSPQVSPRGDRLVYAAKRQLFAIALTAEAKPETLIAQQGSRNTLRWSPDGTKLAFVSGRREHAFIGVYDFASKSIRYLDPGVDRDSFPAWSPDSKQLAFIRIPNRQEVRAFGPERSGVPWSIRVADAATGKGREVWRADKGTGSVYRGIVADDQLVWAANDRLVFPWEKNGWTNLYSLPAAGGAAKNITPGTFEVEHVSFSPDRSAVVYSTNAGDVDRRHIWRVPVDGSARPVAVTTGKGNEWSPRYAGETLAMIHGDWRQPSTPAILSGAAGFSPPKDLVALPPSFPAASLIEPKQVIFTSPDGMKIHAQLFLPPGGASKHPAAVFFHGGSRRQMLLGWHYGQYYHNAYAMNQFLAGRGYVVLSVNYRSGIGYGMKFREAENYGTRGASEVNDVIGAANYLRTRVDVDPKKIAAWGGSYGGYLVAFALAKASNLYAAGVDFHGVHDWNNEIKNWEPTYDPRTAGELGKLAYRSSPIAYVATWKSPVLLIHGDDDRNVPFNESIHLAEELRKRNVEVETLVFPDDIHDFLLHENWIAAYRAAAEFLDRKLGR